jgi:hypothetical protein
MVLCTKVIHRNFYTMIHAHTLKIEGTFPNEQLAHFTK